MNDLITYSTHYLYRLQVYVSSALLFPSEKKNKKKKI